MSLFIPSNKIVIPGGDSGQAKKVAIASKEWFDLQNRVQSVLNLPFDIGSYEMRYGDSSSGEDMRDIFKAMRELRNVASKYGNPRSLREKITFDPNSLVNVDKPQDDAYSSIIWTMSRSHNNTLALANTLRNIPSIARRRSAEDAVRGIKGLFLNTNRIVDNFKVTVDDFDVLAIELSKLESELETSQLAMQTYSEKSSKTRVALDEEIGALENKIKQLEKDRDAAYDAWLALTISAVAAAAGIAILGVAISVALAAPTAGTSLAVGSAISVGAAAAVGSALGIAAGVARGSYDSLVTEVRQETELKGKRVAFRHDLGALDQTMKFTLPSSSGLKDQVKGMKFGFESLIDEMRVKAGELTVDNLHTGPWLKDDEMNAAADRWMDVDKAISAFTGNALVDYDLVNFGDDLPADDPNWQEKFVASVA